MLQGFIKDTVFYNPDTLILGNIGVLPDNLDSIYTTPEILTDNRMTRLSLTYSDSTITENDFITYLLKEIYPTVIGKYHLDPTSEPDMILIQSLLKNLVSSVNGQMNVGDAYLVDRSMNIDVHYDSSLLNDDELNTLSMLTAEEFMGVFNIIEFLYLGVRYQHTRADIESVLMSDTDLFKGYHPDSFELVKPSKLCHLYDGVNMDALVPPYIQFTISKGGGTHQLEFKLYLHKGYFEKNYSYSEIIAITPPTDIGTLHGLTTSEMDVYRSLSESRETLHETLAYHITKDKSYSGLFSYDINYIDQNTQEPHSTTFVILYDGKEPDLYLIKSSIKQLLLDSGIGDEDSWKLRYPSLFVDNLYYIVPMYNTGFNTDNRELYKSSFDMDMYQNTLSKVDGSIPTTDVDICVLLAYYKSMLNVVINDENNVDDISIAELFNDYVSIDRSSELFGILDESTKEFVTKINQAVAKANGEDNDTPIVNLQNNNYARFTVASNEFLVLTKDSFNDM